MGQAKKDPSKLEEAEAVKAKVKANADRLAELEKRESELEDEIHKLDLTICPENKTGPPEGSPNRWLLGRRSVLLRPLGP